MRRLVMVALLLVAGLMVPAGPASAALPGHELVWSPYEPANSTSSRQAVATCPAGKYVVGAFAYTYGAPRDVVITALVPTATVVVAAASEDQDGTTASWGITAQAVCAAPPPGLTTVSVYSSINSLNKFITLSCPAGTTLLTAGWDVGSAHGQVMVNQVAPSLTGLSVTGMEDQDGHAGTWRVNAHGVCANPLPGHNIVSGSTAASSVDKSVLIDCGPGRRRLAAAWSLTGSGTGSPAGQVLAQPGSSGTGWMEITGTEDDDGYSGSWSLTGRGICLTV